MYRVLADGDVPTLELRFAIDCAYSVINPTQEDRILWNLATPLFNRIALSNTSIMKKFMAR